MTTVTAPSPESLSPPAPTTPAVSNPSPVTTTPSPSTTPEAGDSDSPQDDGLELLTPSTTSTTTTPPGFTSSQKPDGVKSPSGKSLSPPSSKSNQTDSSSSQDSTGIYVGVSVAGIVIMAMIIVCIVCASRKKRRPYYDTQAGGGHGEKRMRNNGNGVGDHVVKLPPHSIGSNEFSSGFSGGGYNLVSPMSPNMGGLGGLNTSSFSYEELEVATGGFSQSNMIGQGGFGYVYKGVLQNGKEVAVKSLKSGSGQGEREFQAEVEIISRVHHRYLVSLVGYCITNGQRMLVYDFVPNGTLEHHLHGKDQPTMQWAIRMRIALGSAKGLAYLHEDCHPRIIHRDIKAANILLDFNFEAMVADFGLAKLTTDNHTHVSTRVMGTFGYLAPEYASSGKLSDKSDVFSFGVMLLELITGKRPVDPTSRMEDSLVDWARPLLARALEDGNYDELVDPRLEDNFDRNEMARLAACTSASIRHSARRRPKMSQVVRTLEGSSSLDDLIEVPKYQSGQQLPSPGSSSGLSEMNSSMYDTGAYNADMMKFRKMILTPDQESKEYTSD